MFTTKELSLRYFLKSAVATAGVLSTAPHWLEAEPPAKYTRYEINSSEGQKALDTYDKAIQSCSPYRPRTQGIGFAMPSSIF